MKRALFGLTAALVTLVLAEGARAEQVGIVDVPFERYTLDNGIEVILHRDNSVPLVFVDVWYRVGSADERPGESGFAHLFEHVFKNSEHLGGRHHYAILREAGASASNATTNADRTRYFEQLPSNQLELALWLESDRMGYFLPGLTAERFEAQRDIVRNERRQNYEDKPYGRERFAIAELLYPEGHPRRYLTIGRHEDLEQASVDMVIEFYKKWYAPANATLLVAGDFDPAQARALIDKWFGSFPASRRPERVVPVAPALDGPRQRVIEDPFAKARRIHWVWHSPAALTDDDARLSLLSSMLTRRGTGRLYRRLILDQQLAHRLSSYQASSRGGSEWHLRVDLRDDADMDLVRAIMEEELARARFSRQGQSALTRAITAREAQRVWALERLRTRAAYLHYYNLYAGRPDFFDEDLDRYRKVTVAGIRDAVERWLAPERRVEVITLPRPASGIERAAR